MNKEFKRMMKLAGLTEIKVNPNNLSNPQVFQNFLNRIPNEKYFSIADQEADYFFNEEELPKSYNWEDFDDDMDGDLVDYFYGPIFNNELKGKPGIEGNNFNEFQDIDAEKDKEKEGYFGRRTIMLVDKIRDIITAYKEKNSSSDKIPLTPRVKKYIDEVIQDAKNDGEIENLLNAGFFDTDLADNILTKFMDPFPNAFELSQEVENYIDSQL